MLKEHNVVRPSNGETPKKIAFIQCVGSRDRQIGNEYCSKVCCGIASKQAIELREQIPDSKVMIFYIDMRMYGYWENEIYWPAQEKYKVNFVKGVISEVLKKGDKLLIRGEDTTMSRPMEVEMDMVVLSVGMEPSAGTRAVAQLMGIQQNKYGFIESGGAGGLDPVATSKPASSSRAPHRALRPRRLHRAGSLAARALSHPSANFSVTYRKNCLTWYMYQPQQSHILKQERDLTIPFCKEPCRTRSRKSSADVNSIADELSARQERIFLNFESDSASWIFLR